jgi:lysozyme family protein
MTIPSYKTLAPSYAKLWNELVPTPAHVPELIKICNGLIANKATYQAVSQTVWGTPDYWWYVAITDQMEGGGGANTFLGNGQSLSRVTTEVPVGEGPFANFHDGAVVALRGVPAPRTIEQAAYNWESFNGWGYLNKPIENPYLASQSNKYTAGKYVADHVYDPNAVSQQPGALTILKVLIGLDPSIQIPLEGQVPPIKEPPMPDLATLVAQINAMQTALAQLTQQVQALAAAPAAQSVAPQPAPAVPPTTPQITIASTLAHLQAFGPLVAVISQFLPPPWNQVVTLVAKGANAGIDIANAMQTDPSSVGTVVNQHVDVISGLLTGIEQTFPAIKPFADAFSNAAKVASPAK